MLECSAPATGCFRAAAAAAAAAHSAAAACASVLAAAEIGVGLTGLGFLFFLLGVLFFFDRGLLAMGNVSCSCACMPCCRPKRAEPARRTMPCSLWA